MRPGCILPDGTDGVAIRLSGFLQCQARVLGENGFQALAGGPMMAALLSGLLTIFIALIGYRLMFGTVPTARDSVGWSVRVGLVIALGTGWPAFQTVVYRVVLDGPAQLSAIVTPAAGLSIADIGGRVQRAYDDMRTGAAALAIAPAAAPGTATGGTQPPIAGAVGEPQIASLFVVSTIGVPAALQLGAGLLLAIGPLMMLALLFDATLGLFAGWLRALGGLALGMMAADAVGALQLLFVEDAIARSKTIGVDAAMHDPQALTTIVLAFTLILVAALWAMARTAGAIRLSPIGVLRGGSAADRADTDRHRVPTPSPPPPERSLVPATSPTAVPDRAQGIAEVLARSVQRDRRTVMATALPSAGGHEERSDRRPHGEGELSTVAGTSQGSAGQRMVGRRTRSAHQRDRSI
ncbi:type IV secretion system protein [Sphingomonas sp. Leaf4]|uniref:type IV secretion system protein n=1 Tax=Sphingomonas sp. Leaf4 TaxID=2876553 RepID=UPI001E2E815F|nr:type IV secretion system protein [Sphingomonas sp. Leaf4]